MPGHADRSATGSTSPPKPSRSEQWRHLPAVPMERPGATQRWLRTLCSEKRLPFSKVGGKVFVNLDDLDALMDAHVVKPD